MLTEGSFIDCSHLNFQVVVQHKENLFFSSTLLFVEISYRYVVCSNWQKYINLGLII